MLRLFLVSSILFFVYNNTLGQANASVVNSPKKLDRKAKGKFYSGLIRLSNGEEIRCELRYDSTARVVYEKHDDLTRPYSANNISYFEYNIEDQTRKYYSLPYGSYERGTRHNLFFRVLYEKSRTAILSSYQVNYNGVQTYSTPGAPGLPGGTHAQKSLSYSHIIFLVQESEGIKPFLQQRDLISTFKVIDKKLPESFFGTDYPAIKKFVKEGKLKFSRLEDLIKIMDYYISIKTD